jgi:hypothetical protein
MQERRDEIMRRFSVKARDEGFAAQMPMERWIEGYDVIGEVRARFLLLCGSRR